MQSSSSIFGLHQAGPDPQCDILLAQVHTYFGGGFCLVCLFVFFVNEMNKKQQSNFQLEDFPSTIVVQTGDLYFRHGLYTSIVTHNRSTTRLECCFTVCRVGVIRFIRLRFAGKRPNNGRGMWNAESISASRIWLFCTRIV